jgi:hypothetical protein
MSFEEQLLKAIDEAFSSIGEGCRQSIYYHLEKKYKLTKQTIPNQIEKFSEAIERIFDLGAKVLEIRIISNLYRKMECSFPYLFNKNSLDFVNYVESARSVFNSHNKEMGIRQQRMKLAECC